MSIAFGPLVRAPGVEGAVLVSNRVDPRLKYLAVVKASTITGCPF